MKRHRVQRQGLETWRVLGVFDDVFLLAYTTLLLELN